MKAIVEYWTTGVSRFTSDYWIIARNAFLYNGVGLSVAKALVVGASLPLDVNDEKRIQYTFLWVVDPTFSSTLGYGTRYNVEFRQGMCDLFRLVKSEIIFDDMDVISMENSMLNAPKDFDGVQFVEEMFASPGSEFNFDRKYLYNCLLRSPPHSAEVVHDESDVAAVAEQPEVQGNGSFLSVPDGKKRFRATLMRPVSVWNIDDDEIAG